MAWQKATHAAGGIAKSTFFDVVSERRALGIVDIGNGGICTIK
jgi:hypothetical protein